MPFDDGFNFSDKTLISYDPEVTPNHVEVPSGCTAISDGVFSGCTAESITLPDSVTSIGNELFAGCENLREVKLPKLLKKLGTGTFRSCSLLEKISLPDSITGFEESLFEGCASLREIPFRAGIKELPVNVFAGCEGLISLVVPETVETVKSLSCSYCTELQTLVLPKGLRMIEDEAFTGCISLKHIRFSDDNPVFFVDEDTGCLFQKNDDESLTLIKVPSSITELRLTENVTSAHTEAFDGAENIETVYMDCDPSEHPLFVQLKTKLVSAQLINENESFSLPVPEPETQTEKKPAKEKKPKAEKKETKKKTATRKPSVKKTKKVKTVPADETETVTEKETVIEKVTVIETVKVTETETVTTGSDVHIVQEPVISDDDSVEKIALTDIPALALPDAETEPEEKPKKKRKYTRRTKKVKEEMPVTDEPAVEETDSEEVIVPAVEETVSEEIDVPAVEETVPEEIDEPVVDEPQEESAEDAYSRWLKQEQAQNEIAESEEESSEEDDELKGITITADELDAAMARGMQEPSEDELTCTVPEGFFPEAAPEEEPSLPSERPEPVFINGMESMSKLFLILKEKDIFPEHFDENGEPLEPVKIAEDGLPEDLEDIKTMIVIAEKASPLTQFFSSSLIRYAIETARQYDIRKIYFFAEMSLDNDEFLFGFGKFAHYRNIVYAVETDKMSEISRDVMSFADIADISSPSEILENAGAKDISPKEKPFKLFIQDNYVEGLLRLAIKFRKENGIDD